MAQQDSMRRTAFGGALLMVIGVAICGRLLAGAIRKESRESASSETRRVNQSDVKMDRAELRERYKTNLSAHYLSLHITVVGVVLAAAAAAAASLISRHVGSDEERIVLWLLWVGSLAATAVAYGGPMVGAFALPDAAPVVSDLLLPLLVGIAEFLLFTILVSPVSPVGVNSLVSIWLITVAAFSFVAFLSVRRARYHYAAGVDSETYAEDARRVAVRYLRSLTRDSFASAAVTVIAAVGAGLRMSHAIAWPDYVFPIILVVLLLLGLRGHSETARLWRDFFSEKTDSPGG